MLAFPHWQADPARRERAQKLPVRENGNWPPGSTQISNDLVRSSGHLFRRFPSRTTIQKHVPVGTFGANLRSGPAFEVAVIPLAEIRLDASHLTEPSQFARSASAQKRAHQNERKRNPLQN